MATVTSIGGSRVVMGSVVPINGAVAVNTPTTFRRGHPGNYDEFVSASGDFTYDLSNNLVDGTITGWIHVENDIQYQVTDISTPVSEFPFAFEPVDDVLFAGADSITGSALNDHLLGFGGKDTLVGLDGEDYLDGGAGADSMSGGAGNDLYQVDDKSDIVSEGKDQGIDTVESAADHTLAANVENLTLITMAAAAVGTGNELDNTIAGNIQNNELNGLAGNDTIDGFFGDDTVDGGADFDVISLSPMGTSPSGGVTFS
ncbi:MAG TPA: calcium-binding protein, partial [Dongiaceae bacterium]